jgi:hypothetical protein
MLDISNIYRDIEHLKLKSYNSPFPTIFISAQNPDDACNLVINNLIQLIMKQDDSIKMRIICRKIRRRSKVDKIYILN